ncbi:unnamed protein product [Caretta caretta]
MDSSCTSLFHFRSLNVFRRLSFLPNLSCSRFLKAFLSGIQTGKLGNDLNPLRLTCHESTSMTQEDIIKRQPT